MNDSKMKKWELSGALLLAGIMFAFVVGDFMMKPRDMHVAVVGGGLAGLTTAYRLKKFGFKVTVFEARPRVGGRVFTVQMRNAVGEIVPAELGGQNIVDGGEAENITSLAKECGLSIITNHLPVEGFVYDGTTYCSQDELFRESLEGVSDIEAFVGAVAPQANSIGDLIQKLFPTNTRMQQVLSSRVTAYEGIPAEEQSIYHNLDTFMSVLSGGIAPAHDGETGQQRAIVVRSIEGGNARLPLALAKELGERVVCNAVVTKIATKKEGFVELTFADGAIRSFNAVVAAVPAATYSSIDVSETDIEPARWKTMSSLGYGKQYKIMVPYKTMSTSSPLTFGITDWGGAFFNPCRTVMILYANTHIADPVKRAREIERGFGYEPVERSLLVPESVRDEQYALYEGAVTHEWANDPYARGSYSGYSTTISDELDEAGPWYDYPVKKLFAPIGNRIFFAGEHTTVLEYIGTMEAAVESGERTADMVCAALMPPPPLM